MSMIDKVAIAIWVARGDYPKTATEVGLIWPVVKDGLMAQASGAIEAMREPTTAMDAAGVSAMCAKVVTTSAVYRAMIDAALQS